MHMQSLTVNTFVECLGDTYVVDSVVMDNEIITLDLRIKLDSNSSYINLQKLIIYMYCEES